MADGTLVTFNENVDTYVRGDVVRLDADELKRVDAYAERWKIKNAYSKGAKTLSDDDRTTTARRTNVPNESKTADTAMASQGNVNSTSTDSINKPAATKPEGDGGEQAAMTDGQVVNEDKADEPANNTVNDGGDTSLSEPAAEDDANVLNDSEHNKAKAAAEGELPPVTSEPVSDEGSKPNTGKKANNKK